MIKNDNDLLTGTEVQQNFNMTLYASQEASQHFNSSVRFCMIYKAVT